MEAFIHFGGPFTDEQPAPRLTIKVPVKDSAAPRSGRTVTGYGFKIPVSYKVKYLGRWRRVYCASYGNAGTAYIIINGAPGATVDIYHN